MICSAGHRPDAQVPVSQVQLRLLGQGRQVSWPQLYTELAPLRSISQNAVREAQQEGHQALCLGVRLPDAVMALPCVLGLFPLSCWD